MKQVVDDLCVGEIRVDVNSAKIFKNEHLILTKQFKQPLSSKVHRNSIYFITRYDNEIYKAVKMS